MPKRLVVFNHKGGVCKTTSVYNIGWMLSEKFKVLVVDADSQCNLSSLVLGEDFEKYYVDDSTRLHNIKDGVSAAFKGKPHPIAAVNCFSPQKASSMYLLAGHADLTEYEAALSFAQMSNNALATLQNLPGAFSELLRLTEEKYSIDYTIIDLNPSLSAINQNLFLSANAFVIPTNPDPFSIMAINTLKSTLPRWANWKRTAIPLFAESAYPLLDSVPKFSGTLIQRFNIRNGKAAKPYRDNIEEIKQTIRSDFYNAIQSAEMTFTSEEYGNAFIGSNYCLEEIPDFQGLLPKAQKSGVPVFAITDSEIGETGPVLSAMQAKRQLFRSKFIDITDKLVGLLAYA